MWIEQRPVLTVYAFSGYFVKQPPYFPIRYQVLASLELKQ